MQLDKATSYGDNFALTLNRHRSMFCMGGRLKQEYEL